MSQAKSTPWEETSGEDATHSTPFGYENAVVWDTRVALPPSPVRTVADAWRGADDPMLDGIPTEVLHNIGAYDSDCPGGCG